MTDSPKPWPQHGPDFNAWNGNFKEFTELLSSAAEEGWWVRDTQLKYLVIRVDTRDNGFLLFDRDKNQISPNRVVEAIEQQRKEYGDLKDKNQSQDNSNMYVVLIDGLIDCTSLDMDEAIKMGLDNTKADGKDSFILETWQNGKRQPIARKHFKR